MNSLRFPTGIIVVEAFVRAEVRSTPAEVVPIVVDSVREFAEAQRQVDPSLKPKNPK